MVRRTLTIDRVLRLAIFVGISTVIATDQACSYSVRARGGSGGILPVGEGARAVG